MFMINGIVGLDANETEELQTVSPHLNSSVYHIDHLRSLLEQNIEACQKRKQELHGKDLLGEYLCKEGEIWESIGDCLGAKLSMECCLANLNELTGNESLAPDDGNALQAFMRLVKTEKAKTAHTT